MKRFALTLALLALMIPSMNLARQVAPQGGTIEKVLGIQVDPEGVTFQVYSGGCTDSESFMVRTYGNDPVRLLLVRFVPDPCEALVPYGTTVHYTWDKLGLENGDSFIVRNPRRTVTVIEIPSTA